MKRLRVDKFMGSQINRFLRRTNNIDELSSYGNWSLMDWYFKEKYSYNEEKEVNYRITRTLKILMRFKK